MKAISTRKQAEMFASWLLKHKDQQNRNVKIVNFYDMLDLEVWANILINQYRKTFIKWDLIPAGKNKFILVIEEWDGANTIYLLNVEKRG